MKCSRKIPDLSCREKPGDSASRQSSSAKILLLTGAFLALSGMLRAQDVSFSARADTTRILIGEQVHIFLRAELESPQDYTWPALPDSLQGMEVVHAAPVDTLEENGQWVLQQQMAITSFDSGYAAFPALTFTAGEQTANSGAIEIEVVFPGLTEETEFYDIKGLMEVGINWTAVALWAAGALLVIALAVWLIMKYRKREKKEEIHPERLLSPEEYARQELSKLEQEQLWQKGELKAYYSRLIDILRVYMERQLDIPAMESTAEEIISDLERQPLPESHFGKLRHTLRLSAMVKFAKQKPAPSENEEALSTVRAFIDITRPRIINEKTGTGNVE